MKASEKIYPRYEALAMRYARRLYGYEALGLEYDDLLQEFRIKIFMALKAYGRRYLKYQRGEASLPVPLKFYLETACANKARDLMKLIGGATATKVRLDDLGYDYGVECDTEVSADGGIYRVHGVDLLEGLVGRPRVIFTLYLKGYTLAALRHILGGRGKVSVDSVVAAQKAYLITNYADVLLSSPTVYRSTTVSDDD